MEMPSFQKKMHNLNCWICGSDSIVAWKSERLQRHPTPNDFKVTDYRYGFTLPLFKCCQCEFIFADRETIDDPIPYYEELTDYDYQSSQKARRKQMNWLLAKVRRTYPRAESLLDIGAGVGLLVKEARTQGFEAIGIEPCRFFVRCALRDNGVEILHGTLPHPSLKGRRFDLVFLVDVIEHVVDPVSLLKHCRAALRSDGAVVVITPDVSSLAARIFNTHWWHYRVAHVGYFNRHSLARAAASAELSVSGRFRPKWFFQVEYISERLAHYLPISRINRIAEKIYPLHSLNDRVISLNLFDSLGVFLRTGAK